jgi:hypothetical protein
VKDLPREGLRYRVVLMRRDLKEVLRSQKKMLERRGMKGGNLSDERAAALYAKQLDELVAYMKGEPAFSFLEANYNELVRAPVPAIQGIAAFLGGGLDEAAMAQQVDRSLYRSGG